MLGVWGVAKFHGDAIFTSLVAGCQVATMNRKGSFTNNNMLCLLVGRFMLSLKITTIQIIMAKTFYFSIKGIFRGVPGVAETRLKF